MTAGSAASDGDGEGFPGVGAGQRPFDEGEDLLVQEFSSAGKALFDGVPGQFQVLRDGFDGLMLAIEENERFAVDFRDAFDGTPEDAGFLLADGEIVRLGLGCGRRVEYVERFADVAGFAALFFEGIVSEVASDAAKPGTELLRFAEAGKLFPGGEESLLGEVFALVQAAGGAVSKRANEVLVAGDDLPERHRDCR